MPLNGNAVDIDAQAETHKHVLYICPYAVGLNAEKMAVIDTHITQEGVYVVRSTSIWTVQF